MKWTTEVTKEEKGYVTVEADTYKEALSKMQKAVNAPMSLLGEKLKFDEKSLVPAVDGSMFFFDENQNYAEEIYYNPDGNDGKGQYVSNQFCKSDIAYAMDTDSEANESEEETVTNFFTKLEDISSQYLYDVGTKEFVNTASILATNNPDSVGDTKETMQKLIDWAKSEVAKEDDKPHVCAFCNSLIDDCDDDITVKYGRQGKKLIHYHRDCFTSAAPYLLMELDLAWPENAE